MPGKRQGGSSTKSFGTASALFEHLNKRSSRLTVSGAIHPINGNNKSVLFTPNGHDWLALPTKTIKDAKLVGEPNVRNKMTHVQVTLTRPKIADGALFSEIATLHHPSFSAEDTQLPDASPPSCPVGTIPRWVGGRWICVRL